MIEKVRLRPHNVLVNLYCFQNPHVSKEAKDQRKKALQAGLDKMVEYCEDRKYQCAAIRRPVRQHLGAAMLLFVNTSARQSTRATSTATSAKILKASRRDSRH